MTIHRIIQGDTKKGLKSLPEKCVQLTVTSPPYFGLRKYLGDDVPGKEYEIGLEETPEQYIKNLVEVFREVRRVTRDDGILYLNLGDSYAGSGKGPTGKNGIQSAEKRMGFDKSDTNRGSHKYNLLGGKIPQGLKSKDLMGIPWKVAFALQTNGARSPETIIEIDKIRSALLSDFNCWAEVPKHTREAIEDLDNEWEHAHQGAWYFRSAMPWIKRNCLSGGTWLYVKSQKGVMPMTVKDLSRLDPESTQLWDGEKWNQVMETFEREIDSRDELYEIELQSGEKIGCTEDHKWPTVRGLIQTKDLIKGDVLKTCTLPDTNVYAAGLPSPDIGWLCGLYLSEGHKSGDSIIFSGNVAETESRYARLSEIISDYQGTIFTTKEIGNGQKVCVSGKVLFGIIDQYIFGKTSKTKHLTRKAWSRDNSFLDALLKGYLQGDGHWDKENSRWRLGFTNNEQLVIDLRVICARLGYSISLRRSYMTAEKGGEKFASWRGEIRMERKVASTIPGTFRPSERTEIVRIGRSRARKVWDIVLKDEPHLYSLASGVLTHNCMPESTTDRPASAIEYVFLMTKSHRYYYDAEAIRCPSSESYRNDPRPAGTLRQRVNKKSKYPDKGQFKKVDWAADKLHNGKTGHFHEKEKMAALGTNIPGHSGILKADGTPICDGLTRSYRNSDPFFESWQGLYSEAENPLAFIINPQARPELHFASFPNLLAETCIKAGTSEYGCCPKCGTPWQRIVEKNPNPSKWAHDENDRGVPKSMGGNKQSSKSLHRNGNNCQMPRGKTTGWQSNCKCKESERIPCTVLDPFMGRGTVAIVARDLGRSSIGCELNPDYIEIIKQQLQSNSCLDTGTIEYIFTKV